MLGTLSWIPYGLFPYLHCFSRCCCYVICSIHTWVFSPFMENFLQYTGNNESQINWFAKVKERSSVGSSALPMGRWFWHGAPGLAGWWVLRRSDTNQTVSPPYSRRHFSHDRHPQRSYQRVVLWHLNVRVALWSLAEAEGCCGHGPFDALRAEEQLAACTRSAFVSG